MNNIKFYNFRLPRFVLTKDVESSVLIEECNYNCLDIRFVYKLYHDCYEISMDIEKQNVIKIEIEYTKPIHYKISIDYDGNPIRENCHAFVYYNMNYRTFTERIKWNLKNARKLHIANIENLNKHLKEMFDGYIKALK